VSFKGKAIAITENQLYFVMNLLKQNFKINEVQDLLFKGANAEIIAGPFIKVSGELMILKERKE
jgi:hypothetical protein